VAERGAPCTEAALPFIAERDAAGEVAELYAEIRETLGLPVVNLIWRHFATIDGGLRWAWDTLRPVYASGAAEQAAAHLVAGLALPRLPVVTAAVLRGAGVSDGERATLLAILDSYNRGNALNICALSALLVEPAGEPRGARRAPPLPRPLVAVPGVKALDEFPPEVQALIWEVNALGQTAGDPVLATAYKHVAPWPGFLSLSWALLAPMHRDGSLVALVAQSARAARAEAAHLARLKAAAADSPAAPAVRAAAVHFVEHVIGRMIPIVQMLRRALPDD